MRRRVRGSSSATRIRSGGTAGWAGEGTDRVEDEGEARLLGRRGPREAAEEEAVGEREGDRGPRAKEGEDEDKEDGVRTGGGERMPGAPTMTVTSTASSGTGAKDAADVLVRLFLIRGGG